MSTSTGPKSSRDTTEKAIWSGSSSCLWSALCKVHNVAFVFFHLSLQIGKLTLKVGVLVMQTFVFFLQTCKLIPEVGVSRYAALTQTFIFSSESLHSVFCSIALVEIPLSARFALLAIQHAYYILVVPLVKLLALADSIWKLCMRKTVVKMVLSVKKNGGVGNVRVNLVELCLLTR